MADSKPSSAAAEEVIRSAREGKLADDHRTADGDRRRYLWAGAVEIVEPLVFRGVTRPRELRLGHPRCAAEARLLTADCLDRHLDDVEAVVQHLLTRAGTPIRNIEGWITVRIPPAIVDAYRRSRGSRGALQRPRVPKWLSAALDHDAWMGKLAESILDWAGSRETAGSSLWPVAAWTERRITFTGDHTATEGVVGREVEIVLAAMRRRPDWYEKYVERPMGHKPAPVWIPARSADGTQAEPEPLVVPAHEQADAQLSELAARAVELIAGRVRRGEEPALVVAEVLRTVFGDVPVSADLDRPSGAGKTGPEQVIALIDDPARLEEIITVVVALVMEQLELSDRPSEP